MPEIFQSRNFKGEDIQSLFGSFDTHGDSISFNLIKESDTFFLDITQTTKFGRETQKRLSSQIQHDSEYDIDVLNFGSNFVFPVLNGRVCLDGVFADYGGYFSTTLDLVITRLHFERSFGIFARNIEIIESLSSNKSLFIKESYSLENRGVFFAPFLSIDVQNTVNRGNIHGKDIQFNVSSLKNLDKASIIGASNTHLTAQDILCNSSLISGRNVEINANVLSLENGSGIIGTNVSKLAIKESIYADSSSISAKNLAIKTKKLDLKKDTKIVGKTDSKVVVEKIISDSSEILGDNITLNANNADLDNKTKIEAGKTLNVFANKLQSSRNTEIKTAGTANIKVQEDLESTDSYFQGKNIVVDAKTVDSEKSVILGENAVRISAKQAFRTNSSLVKGKNVKINAGSAALNINSELFGEEKLEVKAREFVIDEDSGLSSKDAIFNVGLFNNQKGKLNFKGTCNLSSHICLNKGDIKGHTIQINTSSSNKDLRPKLRKNLIHSEDVDFNDFLGTFENAGHILGDKLVISTNKNLLNKGMIEVAEDFNFAASGDILNEGHIRSYSESAISKIYTPKKVDNTKGTTTVTGNLEINANSLGNTHGTLEARNLGIELALKSTGQFLENKTEDSCLLYENNPYSTAVCDQLKKNYQASEKIEDKNEEEVKEIGYLANTLGTIRASRDLSIRGSGAIYNGNKAGIVAKNHIAIDVNGRILNQLGSMISAPEIEVKSQGKVFNTGGSEINASMGLDCNSNGLQNGIGSRILGGLKLKSRESVLNLGEITSVKQPLNISTKKFIKNHGTIVSDHNMTFETPEQLLNTGKISGKGIDLKKAYKVTNVWTGITEGESVLFREGAHLYNTGRVAAENLKLSNIIFDQLDGNGGKKIDSAGILREILYQ